MHTHKVLVLAALGASLASAATEVYHTRHRNETARLEYSWIENGCVTKQLTVTASKNKIREDGTTDTKPIATLTYSIYNYCDPANVFDTFWYGQTDSFTMDVAANLKSASVTAPAFVVTGLQFRGLEQTDLGTKSINVDVRWTSNDPLDKSTGTWVTRLPGYTEVSRFNGFYRMATASGLIADGSQNWFPIQYEGNLVQLFRANEGETILTKD